MFRKVICFAFFLLLSPAFLERVQLASIATSADPISGNKDEKVDAKVKNVFPDYAMVPLNPAKMTPDEFKSFLEQQLSLLKKENVSSSLGEDNLIESLLHAQSRNMEQEDEETKSDTWKDSMKKFQIPLIVLIFLLGSIVVVAIDLGNNCCKMHRMQEPYQKY